MKLIDADALNAKMYHDAFETDSDMQKWDGGCWIRYKMFENAIKNAPTIEERKKGKWIPNSPVTMKCDQCGYVIRDWRWNESNFCANCGSDMRGEQAERREE